MQANALFTFSNSIFVKYDLLTEYLTLFWFAMFVNHVEFQFKKEFEQCLYLVFFVSFLGLNSSDLVHDKKPNYNYFIIYTR